MYIPTVHFGATFRKPEKYGPYRPGRFNTNVSAGFGVTTKDPALLKDIPDPTPSAALKAWDPVKKQVVWTGPKKAFMDHGGVLSTASGLVMQGGLDGNLRIFDDANGTLLREIMIGSAMIAAPMTYSVDGVQYVAILTGSGGGGWSTWAPDNIASRNGNANRIVALRLGGGAIPQPEPLQPLPPMSEPPARTRHEGGHRGGPQTVRRELRTLPHQCGPRPGARPASLDTGNARRLPADRA